MSAAIELVGVDKHYRGARALESVTLRVERGELCLLSGSNGAGKTTLLRVVAGIARPRRGEVRVLGAPVFSAAGRALRSRVGYLGPDSGLYAELGVLENLLFAAALHGLPAGRARELLGELDLEPLAARRVRTLSSGFRRRAALARALLTGGAGLLLLDEPWNGLDAAASAHLERLLRASRAAGGTALVVAHVDPAPALFDREVRLEAGRVEAGKTLRA